MHYDALGIGWEYEAKTIPLIIDGREVSYIPDFVLDNGCMIEVKGRERYGGRDGMRKPRKAIEMGYDLMVFRQDDLEMVLPVSISFLNKEYSTGGFPSCDALIRSMVV